MRSEGGGASIRLRLTLRLWRLSQVRKSRVWQDRIVIEIVGAMFLHRAPLAQWCWSDDAQSFMADGARAATAAGIANRTLILRSACSKEGLAWRYEQLDAASGDCWSRLKKAAWVSRTR